MKKISQEKKYPFKATFSTVASLKKHNFASKTFVSNASISSLNDLRKLAPPDAEIKDNSDLLYTVFNIAVTNLVNLNGDALDNNTALSIAKYFKNRPMNLEHSPTDIVGVVTNVGFSSFPDNSIKTEEELQDTTDPFNISLAAIVWKYNNPWFSNYLYDCSEDDSYCYQNISTSWEIAFDDYKIARGSKNLNNAEIISDKDEIKRLSPYLTCYGGNGFDETNTEIYRILSGEVRPLGGGFVEHPAASVKGVNVIEVDEEDDDEEDEDENEDEVETDSVKMEKKHDIEDMEEMDSNCNTKKSDASIIKINDNKFSQKTKITVRDTKYMKFNNIDEMYEYLSDASEKGETFSPTSVKDLFVNQIKLAEQDWVNQLNNKKDEMAQLQAALAEAKANIATLEELKKELEDTKASIKEQENINTFNARISLLDDKYNLNDKARKVIANKIMGQTEEEFAAWLADEGEIMLAGKEKKEPEKEISLEDSLKVSSASIDVKIPNATVTTNPSVVANKTPQVARKDSSFVISLK